jgi:hypothetical protein
MTAVEKRTPPMASSRIAPSSAAARPVSRPRGRLLRKYALLFIALVGAALIVNSALDFWFSYQENKDALLRVQQEKADAAAGRIAEFVDEIERQIGWTTHARWAAGPLDQRRFDYVRLLRQVPAITELTELDGAGKEQLKVRGWRRMRSVPTRISRSRPPLRRRRRTASGSVRSIFARNQSPT